MNMKYFLRTFKFAASVLRYNFVPAQLPYKAILLVTWRCQARCLMCNIWKKEKQNELTLDEWRTFFQRNSHLKWLTLSGGEPFLRTDLEQIIRAALRYCPGLYYINMPTNALSPDLVQKTIESILPLGIPKFVLSISLDGPEEVHDKLRGISGAWRRAIKLLAWAKSVEKDNKSRFSVILEHTLLPDSYGRFDEMVAQVQKEVGTVGVNDFMVTIGSSSKHYYGNVAGHDQACRTRDDQHLETAIHQIIEARRRNASWHFIHLFQQYFLRMAVQYIRTKNPPMRCRATRSSVFIDPCGIVYPCNSYSRTLGSLRENDYSIKKLFFGNNMTQIRADIDLLKCGGCWTPCEASLSYIENLLNPLKAWKIFFSSR
jgi:MoaA/NifB/PqqE/SkfB family radical SAM enzyme